MYCHGHPTDVYKDLSKQSVSLDTFMANVGGGGGVSGGGCLNIPDEWSRGTNTTKNAKNNANKKSSSSRPSIVETDDITMLLDDATETKKTVTGPVKKRKRPTAAQNPPTPDPVTTVVANANPTTKNTPPLPLAAAATTFPSSTDPSPETIHMNGHAPAHRTCDEAESVMRGLYHQIEQQSRKSGCSLQDGIYLDSIMTHVPYAEVLQTMFGGNSVHDTTCVPVVTRAYEESYMREPLSGVESACIMGNNCECQFVDEHNPFTGVQFVLPVEAFSPEMLRLGVTEELSENKLCVLCCRKNTQSLFYEALYNHRAYSACIQLYGNICDRPGEYSKEAMLICPLSGPIHNMPLPVVAHQRNRYSVVVHNGVRQLRQHRVGFEDFQMPSSSRC